MYEERAARGARWLDSLDPDWYKGIDPETLDPWSHTRCVIGQTLGNFEDVMDAKFFIPRSWEGAKVLLLPNVWFGIVWTLRHGFLIAPWREYQDEKTWRAAWSKEIETRNAIRAEDTFPAEWTRERVTV